MSKLRSQTLAALVLPTLASLALTVSARAQATSDTTNPTNPNEQPQQLEKFVITGSYIPFSADAPPVPVTTIGSPQIEATGEQGDLLEVIRRSVPQFIGNGNLGASNSNIHSGLTNGGSQIRLRNLQTLVLINGHRAAFAPVSATGGFDFVDVDTIPVSAVERIEVLKDGASALYGSDAVAGVVNIILKKDYQGLEVGGSYKFATQAGHWSERTAHATMGAKSGNTSMTVSVEWEKRDPLFENERKFSEDQTGKTATFPGAVLYFGDFENYILAPGKSPPPNTDLSGAQLVAQGTYTGPFDDITSVFNISPYVTLALSNQRFAATTEITQKLSETTELYGELFYTRVRTELQLAGQPIVGMPYFANFADGFGGPIGYTLPDHPQNPFDDYVLVKNRFLLHPRHYPSDNDSVHGLVGARGQLDDNYHWEFNAYTNENYQDFRETNVINRVNLANAINAGTVNLFDVNQDAAAAAANVFGTAFTRNQSSLNGADLRFNGEVSSGLAAGPIGFAVGAEFRRETLSAEPDAGSYIVRDTSSPLFGQPTTWDGATSTDPFSVARRVLSEYAEVRVPITSPSQHIPALNSLEIDMAVRHDGYSDTDDPTVPKVSLRWLPINDEFAVRASFSKSFSAAPLFNLFGPTGVGYGNQPIGLQLIDGRVLGTSVDQPYLMTPPNPDLKPERSTNYNIGFVYSPRAVKGLTVEADFFDIKQRDIAGTDADITILQDVETNGPTSEFASNVHFGSFSGTPVTAPGQISQHYDARGGSMTDVFITKTTKNIATGHQAGVDLTVEYNFHWDPLGQVNLAVDGLWYDTFKVGEDEYVGTTNAVDTLNGGTIPRWRGDFRFEITHNRFLAGGVLYYFPPVEDTAATPGEKDPTFDSHVESYTQLDLYVGYRFRGGMQNRRYLDGLQVRLGLLNVFNEEPPAAKSSWQDASADTGTYDAYGRTVYVSASYKF